jgi:DNA-binding transcriptional ArsR family regulator
MLRVLFEQPGASVSEIALRTRMPMVVASQYLRVLGARGLINARREGRYVCYRPVADPAVGGAASLLEAVGSALASGPDAVEMSFCQLTAFTHPRRILIARALAAGPLTKDALMSRTRINRFAIYRHLQKLARRGVVAETADTWRVLRPRGRLATVLLRLACELHR